MSAKTEDLTGQAVDADDTPPILVAKRPSGVREHVGLRPGRLEAQKAPHRAFNGQIACLTLLEGCGNEESALRVSG